MTGAQPGPLAPEALAHRYDDANDAVHFLMVPRAMRKAAPFLIDAHLPDQATIVPRADALGAAPAAAPLHFVFHSAYCCSTLVANALDIPGVATSLKEPQILNDLVGWRHRGAAPAAVGQLLDNALTLLSRPFDHGEAVIIKPSNVVNGLAIPMLRLREQSRALLLYAPLPVFLASIARKGMWGRLWVRELLSRQLVDGLVDLGFEPRDHLLHTDLQAAAVGWLAQQRLFGQMAARWPDRVRTLDSERLVAEPQRALAGIAAQFGLPLDAGMIARIVAAEFSRDAKDGSRFAPGQRQTARQSAETVHGEEIEKVTIWARSVADRAGVAMDPGAPLLN